MRARICSGDFAAGFGGGSSDMLVEALVGALARGSAVKGVASIYDLWCWRRWH